MTTIPLNAATAARLRLPELDKHLVLVGQPDSGTTFALRTLAREYVQAGEPGADDRRLHAYDLDKAGFIAATGVEDGDTEPDPARSIPGRWVTGNARMPLLAARSFVRDLILHGGQSVRGDWPEMRGVDVASRPAPLMLVVLNDPGEFTDQEQNALIELLTNGAQHGTYVVLTVASLDEPDVSPVLRAVIEQHAHVRTTPLPGFAYASTDGGAPVPVAVDWVDPESLGGKEHVLGGWLAAWTHPAGGPNATPASELDTLRSLGVGDLEPAGSCGPDAMHRAHQHDRLLRAAQTWFGDHYQPGHLIAIECADHDGEARLVCRVVPGFEVVAGNEKSEPTNEDQAADQAQGTGHPTGE